MNHHPVGTLIAESTLGLALVQTVSLHLLISACGLGLSVIHTAYYYYKIWLSLNFTTDLLSLIIANMLKLGRVKITMKITTLGKH